MLYEQQEIKIIPNKQLPVLSSMDRILGFEPSGVGSIPAGPAIFLDN